MAQQTVAAVLDEHRQFGRVASPGGAVEVLVPAVRALHQETATLRDALERTTTALHVALALDDGTAGAPASDQPGELDGCHDALTMARATLAAAPEHAASLAAAASSAAHLLDATAQMLSHLVMDTAADQVVHDTVVACHQRAATAIRRAVHDRTATAPAVTSQDVDDLAALITSSADPRAALALALSSAGVLVAPPA